MSRPAIQILEQRTCFGCDINIHRRANVNANDENSHHYDQHCTITNFDNNTSDNVEYSDPVLV